MISKICQKILITSTDCHGNLVNKCLPCPRQGTSPSQSVSPSARKVWSCLGNSPCPRQGTSPSWKFSHGCCLPTRSSSGSRGRRDSWDGKVKLPGESIFLTISNNIMITCRLDSCTPPNANQASEKQQLGLNSTVTCPFRGALRYQIRSFFEHCSNRR